MRDKYELRDVLQSDWPVLSQSVEVPRVKETEGPLLMGSDREARGQGAVRCPDPEPLPRGTPGTPGEAGIVPLLEGV